MYVAVCVAVCVAVWYCDFKCACAQGEARQVVEAALHEEDHEAGDACVGHAEVGGV